MTPSHHSMINHSRLVVVLGMHRSGTSSITRALKVIGVDLGENFQLPDQHNQRGYWEDADVQAFNIEMLHSINRDWDHLTEVSAEDICLLHRFGFKERALDLLRSKSGTAMVFGIKDPRITKLLPFWQTVLTSSELDFDYVLAIRNPMSVARSLQKRNGFDFSYSYFLWLTYTLAALQNGEAQMRIIIDYDRLVQAPDLEVKRLADHLDCAIDSSKMEAFERDFMSKDLRHSVDGLDDLRNDSRCPELVKEIYIELLEFTAQDGNDQGFSSEKITRWVEELKRVSPFLEHIDEMHRRAENPSLFGSLYDVGRSLFRKLPFSNWIRRKLQQ